MTDALPTSPPPSAETPATPPHSARSRQQVTETVQRIMGEDIAPPENPPVDLTQRSHPSNGNDPTTTDVAKDQAVQVADTAKQAGSQVADTVKDQAAQVTAEAGHQAQRLLSQAQSELGDQAAVTQQRVAEGLHALADELAAMTKHSEHAGPATDLARQAADKAHQAAGWLADRDPGTLLDEVRAFARRKPGAYLAIALGAGVLAGRLTRGLTGTTDALPDPRGDVAP
jgi:gas vesicle protein